MKRITAYRCDFCGKVYLTPHGCERHEEQGCCQRPGIRPLCYSCRNYHQELDEKENVFYYIDGNFGESEHMKKFDINRCTHPENECKLYNNFKLSGEMQAALADADFVDMPTPKSGGCQYYDPIPNHPYATPKKNNI